MSSDPSVLDAGYARCAAITREHGTTYYWGARLLPAASRRHVHAVYTLARLADDIVDLAGPEPGAQTAAELTAFEASFWSALEEGGSSDPVMAAVEQTVRECGIEEECFERFFRAMRSDLTRTTYDTWGDLLDYMDGSAAVIGEMMLPVLRPGTDAVAPARSLGLAFQLTNFLRDIGEDLDRGRVYVPQEDIRRFGADPSARVVTDEWRALMAFEIERNRRLYREADGGLPALPPASRRCVATARVLYAQILERIEDADYDVSAVPGPNAAIMALTISGLAADRFVFEGFIPRKGADRAARLAEIAAEHRTTVIYEAPHRVQRTLDDLREVCGDERTIVVTRELTKLHEEVVRGPLGDIDIGGPRGEYVLVLDGAPVDDRPVSDEDVRDALREEINAGSSTRDAAATVAKTVGRPKREVYALAIGLDRQTGSDG